MAVFSRRFPGATLPKTEGVLRWCADLACQGKHITGNKQRVSGMAWQGILGGSRLRPSPGLQRSGRPLLRYYSNALPHIFNEATCFIMLRMISLHSVRLLCVSLLVFSDLKVRQELGMLYEAISHFVRYLGGSE